MSGITYLPQLLASLSPQLTETPYVFVALATGDRTQIDALEPIGVFHETEGTTAICPAVQAEAAGLSFDGTYRLITLQVHSSLQAVGLLAAVTAALAQAGIPVNAISAFYHDHLFIPEAKATAALTVLASLPRRQISPD